MHKYLTYNFSFFGAYISVYLTILLHLFNNLLHIKDKKFTLENLNKLNNTKRIFFLSWKGLNHLHKLLQTLHTIIHILHLYRFLL